MTLGKPLDDEMFIKFDLCPNGQITAIG
jgi:hypothetical protein